MGETTSSAAARQSNADCAGMAKGVVRVQRGFWVQLQPWTDQGRSGGLHRAVQKRGIVGGGAECN